jgi:DNA-binding CsgD family transcriptional regulator
MSHSAASGLARIAEICAAPHDSVVLRRELLGAIRSMITFDAHVWLMTDPVTEVGSAPLAHVPCFAELPQLIRLKYLTDRNRWTTLDPPAASLWIETGGAPERSRMWHELLRHHGVVDIVSVVYRDRWGCWAFLDLWRVGAEAPFTDRDVSLLREVTEPMTAALRESQARTFGLSTPTPPPAGPAVMMLSNELDVRAQTAMTERYLRGLVPPDDERRPVPAAAYNVAAQLVATERGVDDHEPRARVHLAGGRWLTLRAARIDGEPPERGDIAVTIELSSTPERFDVLARASALTPRETEVLRQLLTGASTRAIAGRLFLAESTVQDHLKSMFAKTGVRSRSALVARCVGR